MLAAEAAAFKQRTAQGQAFGNIWCNAKPTGGNIIGTHLALHTPETSKWLTSVPIRSSSNQLNCSGLLLGSVLVVEFPTKRYASTNERPPLWLAWAGILGWPGLVWLAWAGPGRPRLAWTRPIGQKFWDPALPWALLGGKTLCGRGAAPRYFRTGHAT